MEAIEIIETIKWGIELITALVLAVAPVALIMMQKGKLDLFKTLEAATDVAEVVSQKMKQENAPDFEKLLSDAVGHIEELRGKTLSPKLIKKAKARIETLVNQRDG